MTEHTLQKLLESVGDDELSEQMFPVFFNTLLESTVKKVILSNNVRITAQYKLSQYGLKNLSGQLDQSNDEEWMAVIDRIEQVFLEIYCRGTADFGDIDDEFLFRLLLIHNEFMSLKAVAELGMMPLQEMQYCLSIFLLIFKHRSSYDVYTLLLNHRNMMEFLAATVSGLITIRNKKRNCDLLKGCKLTDLISKKERKTFKKLTKVYGTLRCLHVAYSLQNDISSILSEKLNEQIMNASLNRLMSKFEQSLNCVQDKPLNLRKQLKCFVDGQKNMINDLEAVNDEVIMRREKKFYANLYDHLPMLDALMKLVVFLQVLLAFRQFLCTARGCQSIEAFLSLCGYVKSFESLLHHHSTILEQVIEFYSNMSHKTTQRKSSMEEESISQALELLENMKKEMVCINPSFISNLKECIHDLEQLKRRIDFDLVFLDDPMVLKCILDLWRSIESEISTSFEAASLFEGEDSHIDDQTLPDEAEDDKDKGKRKDSESTSRNSMSFDELIESWSKLAVEADLIFRNKFFDEYVDNIKSTLAQYDCLSLGTLLSNYRSIPKPAAMALQYWQLQCYDYLERQNLTGSSLELIKMGSGLIVGKHFHDYLQSDEPSYRVIVFDPIDSSLLHGLLLVETPFDELQQQLCVIPEGLNDVRVEGWNWIQLQKQLLNSSLHLDLVGVRNHLSKGAIAGRYIHRLADFDVPDYHPLEKIVFYKNYEQFNYPNESFVELLTVIDSNLFVHSVANELKLEAALHLKKFRRIQSVTKKDGNDLEKELKDSGNDPLSWSEQTYVALIHKLTENANVLSLRRLLAYNRPFAPDDSLLLKAISTGHEKTFSTLIDLVSKTSDEVIQRAITAHMILPIVSHLRNMNDELIEQTLHVAVKANNLEVVHAIMNTEQNCTNHDRLNRAFQLAVRCNRINMVVLLLGQIQISSELDAAMFTAASRRHWNLAKILLKHGAYPHACIDSKGSLRTTFHLAVAANCLRFVKRCDAKAEQNRQSGLLSLAASTGSLRMIKHLLLVGFNVLDDDDILPMAVQLGYVPIQRMILDRLQVLFWMSPKNEFAHWFNLIEQCKLFEYLLRFVQNKVFNNAECTSTWFTRKVMRKFKLFETFDKDFYIQSVEKSSDDWMSLDYELKQISTNMKEQPFDVHVYDQSRKSYAYFKFVVFASGDTSKNECQTFEVLITNNESPLPVTRLGIQNILTKLQLERSSYSCDIHFFNEGTTETLLRRFKLLQLKSAYCFIELSSRSLSSADFLHEEVRSTAEEVVSRIHLSVGTSDIEFTRFLLKQIGQHGYEDIWTDPLLMHTLVDNDEPESSRKIELAAVLLDAGVNCWILHPILAQSAIDYAMCKQQKPLATFLLTRQCEGLSTFESFRKIIQHGSIDTFKLFLEVGNYNETEIFEHTSNTLLEFNVKQVSFSSGLYTFLLYRLSRYGFANLCADSTAPNNPLEWLESIKLISEWIESLESRADCNHCLGIDNDVLFHLRMVHNHLFFIKDNVQLRQIPLKEMTFLLAIFLSIFKSQPEDGGKTDSHATFRMTINKPALMQFLKILRLQLNAIREEFLRVSSRMEAIVVKHSNTRERSQWESIWRDDQSLPNLSDNVWNNLTSKKKAKLPPRELVATVFSSEYINFQCIMSKRHKNVLKKLTKLYHRVKQMYSLGKIFNVIANFSPTASSKQVTVACMKRFIQIFGECIKSSASSRNLPSKLNNILEKQLSIYIKYNKQTRDVTCHDFPLARKLFSIEDQYLYYLTAVEYLSVVRVTLNILLICTFYEHARCLFGSLRCCRSLESMKDLIRYVGHQNNALIFQESCLENIRRYHADVGESLGNIPKESLSHSSQQALEHLIINHNRRSHAIDHLNSRLLSRFVFKYDDIQVATFAASEVGVVHRMLNVNLKPVAHQDLLKSVEANWKILIDDLNQLPLDAKLIEWSPSTMASLQVYFEINRKSAQEHHCREETRKIVQYFTDGAVIHSTEIGHLEDNLKEKLHGPGEKGYFTNIFALDGKHQAIKSIFGKENIPEFSQKLQKLRLIDERELQDIFDGIKGYILNVLATHNCSTIEDLVEHAARIPPEAFLAIEYWQLQLCEILITTKQFQDNFHTIKSNAQLICGRNYRNYLAHDNSSYDLLTNSPRIKVLVNALTMAESNWKLFDKPKKSALRGLIDVRYSGISWIRGQNDLKQAVLDLNPESIKYALNRGGLPSGKFWTVVGLYDGIDVVNCLDLLKATKCQELLNFSRENVRKTLAMLTPELQVKHFIASSTAMKLHSAIKHGCFENTLKYSGNEGWDQFVSCDQFPRSNNLYLGDFIKYLQQNGNVDEILEILACTSSNKLSVLFCVGSEETIRSIIQKNPQTKSLALQQAIIAWYCSAEFLDENIAFGEICWDHFAAAIYANNMCAFRRLCQIQWDKYSQYRDKLLLVCASLGRIEMIQELWKQGVSFSDCMDTALQVATAQRQWKSVQYLLTCGANPWHTENSEQLSAAQLAIVYRCSKIAKRFLRFVPEHWYSNEMLSLIANYGTVPMLKLFLRSNFNFWLDQNVLVAATCNETDDSMLEFVERIMFNVDCVIHPNLNEWLQMLQECKILTFMLCCADSGNNVVSRCVQNNCSFAQRILEKLQNFSKTTEGFHVRLVSFRESNMEVDRDEDLVNLCTTMQDKIRQLSKLDTSGPHMLRLLYKNNDEVVASVNGTIITYGLGTFSETTDILKAFAVSLDKELSVTNISNDLQDAVKQTCSLSGFMCEFKVTKGVEKVIQHYRLANAGSHDCLIEISQSTETHALKKLLTSVNPKSQTILHQLPSGVTVEVVNLLLVNGADPLMLDNQGQTALIYLLRNNCSWNVVKRIFEHCVKHKISDSRGVHIFNIQDLDGLTVLGHATTLSNLHAVQFLAENGADQTIQNNDGDFPLYKSVMVRNIAIVNILLEQRQDVVNLRRCTTGETVIFQALALNNTELVKLFLDAGADLTVRDNEGFTALAKGILNECIASLRIMLEHARLNNIDVTNDITYNHWNALHCALVKDNISIFKMLLEHEVGGAIDHSLDSSALARLRSILLANDRSSFGFNLFTTAVIYNHPNVREYLLECEALYEQLSGDRLDMSTVSKLLPQLDENESRDEDTANHDLPEMGLMNLLAEIANLKL